MLLKFTCTALWAVGLCYLVYAQTPPLTHQEASELLGAQCQTDTGGGECVHSYMCDPVTNTIINDGSGIVDKRILDTEEVICPLPLICCGSSDDEPNQQSMNIGCGWRHPNGVIASNEIGANNAKLGEFPWLVNVMRFKNQTAMDMSLAYLGDGALIHQRVVLTAAHTVGDVDATLLRVVAGVHDQTTATLPRSIVLVDAVRIHPSYQKETLVNDVALIFLSWNVTFGDHIAPLCLPAPTIELPPDTRCISAGWGLDGRNNFQNITSMVELPIVGKEDCQSLLRVATSVGRYFNLHDSFLCAGGEIGPDTCRGGGGAPLICPIESQPGRYMAIGVVSWDMACGASGVPAVYARVANVRTWIDQNMAEQGLSTATYTA